MDMIIFTTDDDNVELNVKLEDETVWLNRQQMGLLFDRDVKTIGKHVNNVFKEGELDKKVVIANFATTTKSRKNPLCRQPNRLNRTG